MSSSSDLPPSTQATQAVDLSCIDLLNLLRKRLFLKRESLVSHIELATKDDEGHFMWIDLDRTYHTHLIRTCQTLFPRSLSESSLLMTKKAAFVYALEVLNGTAQQAFFDLQSGQASQARAKHEKKRSSRKRRRAAAREGPREAPKVRALTEPDSPWKTLAVKFDGKARCIQCNKSFTSRKTFTKRSHPCIADLKRKKKQPGDASKPPSAPTEESPDNSPKLVAPTPSHVITQSTVTAESSKRESTVSHGFEHDSVQTEILHSSRSSSPPSQPDLDPETPGSDGFRTPTPTSKPHELPTPYCHYIHLWTELYGHYKDAAPPSCHTRSLSRYQDHRQTTLCFAHENRYSEVLRCLDDIARDSDAR